MAEISIPLSAAFVLGFLASRVGLPPLVGYLAAGFGLAAVGFDAGGALTLVADLGVLLLLFGIGLKLTPATLARRVVWAGATAHLALWVAAVTPLLLVLGALGLPLLEDLAVVEAALLAFALGFSSTVFAVKALATTNEAGSLAGRVALGSLVVQDVLAVTFLVVVGGLPSPWAVPLVAGVVALRPLWWWLLDRAGYDELLPVLGLVLALGVGASAFEAVDVKPDVGALVVGLLLAAHPKASDLSRAILGFKDVLLIGFFLSIGLTGAPAPETLVVAAVLLLLLPLKSAGHLAVLSRFRLRARTVWHSTVTLANVSEFGLIVVAVGVTEGLLDDRWATVVAVMIAVSFALASPLDRARYDLYARFDDLVHHLQRDPVSPDDALIDPGDASVLVFGMGRIGEGCYDELVRAQRGRVVGVDRSADIVTRQQRAGRSVVRGDALDADFWERMTLHPDTRMVVLAMSEHRANLEATHRMIESPFDVPIAAIASHPDEVAELEAAGVAVARNLYEEAGQGLADDACAAVPGIATQ